MSGREPGHDPWDGVPGGDRTTGDDLSLLAGWEVPRRRPPEVLCIRSVDFHEPLVGRRARFWLTSFDETGELIALGWRDGLRIVSEVQDLRGQVGRVVEPTVGVQEEADYYRALSGVTGTPRLAAGVSRIWVEQYVGHAESEHDARADTGPQSDLAQPSPSQPSPSQHSLSQPGPGQPRPAQPNPDAWLADVTEDPARPRVFRPVPARTVHALTGRRVIHVAAGGAVTTALRAVGELAWTTDGTIVAPVVEESDWYLWAARSNNERHPSLRAVEASSLWVES